MTIYELIETPKTEIEQLVTTKIKQYRRFPITKKSGKLRWLNEPSEALKQVQTKFLNNFLYKFKTHPIAVGFRRNISVKEGAKRHFGNKTLLNIDLRGFFDSVTASMVLPEMIKRLHSYNNQHTLEWDEADARLLTSLITLNGALPQGSPTSPAMANLVCYKMDIDLQDFAKQNKLIVTRYADDISFSHLSKRYPLLDHIIEITKMVQKYHFKLNYKKTRIMRPHRRMSVTGIVINDKYGIPKYKRKIFRAILHQKRNVDITEREYQQLRGYAEWIRFLNPEQGQKFIDEIAKMNVVWGTKRNGRQARQNNWTDANNSFCKNCNPISRNQSYWFDNRRT